jgi:ubiquinone/menaquinone biosynthesis C-methylase UbiE
MSADDPIGTRPWIEGRPRTAPLEDRLQWFRSHFEIATSEILAFLDDAGCSLDTRRVLDIGCGDGAIDLGLSIKSKPARLLGMDLVQTNIEDLKELAMAAGLSEIPQNLEFGVCRETEIPLPDRSMDAIISWSVFEHVANPVKVLSELRRIIRPGGFMFLQIWPLYWSQHGSHLWYWYPDGWQHQLRGVDEVTREVRASDLQSTEVVDEMLIDFHSLNRLSILDLQRALSATGFRIRRIKLQSDLIEIPKELSHLSVTDLAISGVKLVAVPE